MASYLTSGHVTALDLYDHKLDLIKENAQRLGLADKVKTQKLDASQVHRVFPADSFDKILVDAPCSGIGLIRRKPDIKYNKDLQDFASLKAVQLDILSSVCQTLRKGGIITYSTCTIIALDHPCQNIMVNGCLAITPEQYLTDGFFIAQLRKKA